MKRNNPAIGLRDAIEEIARNALSAGMELATVERVCPTVLRIGGAEVKRDIHRLSGVEYERGDRVAVEMVEGDYLILGKVVEAL